MFKDIFHGYVSIEEKDGFYMTERFNEKLLKFYAEDKEIFIPRIHGSAGITMEFCTSCESFSFDYQIGHYVRDFFTLDIYEDDVFCATYHLNVEKLNGTIGYKKKKAGESKITVYLPFPAHVDIGNIKLDEYKPVCKKGLKKYLALGDSISQGMGAELASMSYPTAFARDMNYNYRNNGVGGYYFNAGSIDEDCTFNPDVITVKYGTNDAGKEYTDEQFDEVISSFYKKLNATYPNADVYVITPVWRAKDMTEDRIYKLALINSIIKKECEKYGFALIDGLKTAPNIDEAFPDGIHPNMLGCGEIVKHLKLAVK